jgi:hypothetical protein
MGLVMKSTAPSSKQRVSMSSPLCAVTNITGMARVNGSSRNCCITAKPSISSITMSSSIRSGCCSRATLSACAPLVAMKSW